MARFLAIDVGAGTLDAMFLDTDSGDQLKFVAKSPTRILAERIRRCTKPSIVISGRQMGGGSVTEAIRTKSRACHVMMTRSAAETIHHRTERIRQLGVALISQRGARGVVKDPNVAWFRTGDIQADMITSMLRALGVEPSVDFLGIAVQDHGTPTNPVSSLDFRHHMFKQIMEENPKPSAFLFEAGEIPSHCRRMQAAAMDARGIRAESIYLMDTGMAAIMGASNDPGARGLDRIIVLDIATSHTLGSLLVGREIGGFFEYHTNAVTPELLRSLIIDLADGNLCHKEIVKSGGHGAYVRKAVGFSRVEKIVATGPKRQILNPMRIDNMVFGAPFGDNMMTGTAGLVLAIAEREGVAIKGENDHDTRPRTG